MAVSEDSTVRGGGTSRMRPAESSQEFDRLVGASPSAPLQPSSGSTAMRSSHDSKCSDAYLQRRRRAKTKALYTFWKKVRRKMRACYRGTVGRLRVGVPAALLYRWRSALDHHIHRETDTEQEALIDRTSIPTQAPCCPPGKSISLLHLQVHRGRSLPARENRSGRRRKKEPPPDIKGLRCSRRLHAVKNSLSASRRSELKRVLPSPPQRRRPTITSNCKNYSGRLTTFISHITTLRLMTLFVMFFATPHPATEMGTKTSPLNPFSILQRFNGGSSDASDFSQDGSGRNPANQKPLHESLGCKWSELPPVIPAVDKTGYFTHTGLFGFAPEMNNRVVLQKANSHVSVDLSGGGGTSTTGGDGQTSTQELQLKTVCNMAVEGTDQLPWFQTSDQVVNGQVQTGRIRKCEFELGANGPYRRCEMIGLELSPPASNAGGVSSSPFSANSNNDPNGNGQLESRLLGTTALVFQPPAQVFTWNSGLECIPIRLDLRCWSALQPSVGIPFPQYTVPGSLSFFTRQTMCGSADYDFTKIASAGSSLPPATGAAGEPFLDKVDHDIVAEGMNVMRLEGEGGNNNLKKRVLRNYYHWDIAHLVDDNYFKKSAPRNAEKAKSQNWMSLHYINWELASGVTLLHAKVESLTPGIHYRLALLRGKDMPWGENHVDGVSGTMIESGQLLERALSSFPGTQDSNSDNFATLHILVHVDFDVSGTENRVQFAKTALPGNSDLTSNDPKLKANDDCIGNALRQYLQNPTPVTDFGQSNGLNGRVFRMFFEFSAMRTHQTAEQLNQHWHGAGGHWLGAFAENFKLSRSSSSGSDSGGAGNSVQTKFHQASLDDLAVDDIEHVPLYLGDVPITCDATHNWPSDYTEVSESVGKSIRINDVFEISHTLHYIRLHIKDKSLARLYVAPESGAVGLVTADLVKLVSDEDDGAVTDIDTETFPPVEAVILPFGNRQRMLAAEIRTPGRYLIRVKTPFLPIGGLYTCKSVKIRLQVSPVSMVVWDDARACSSDQPDGAGLLQEEVSRKVTDSFSPNWMDSTVTLTHKTGNAAKSFMVGNHFNGIGHPVREEPVKNTLLRLGIQSDFLMAGLVVGIWTTPGKQAKVGIPIASPMDQDFGFLELLKCESCMVQIIYVPFQNVLQDKQYCAPYSLDIANVALQNVAKCNLLAPELPLGVSYTQGGGPGFLDGDFFFSKTSSSTFSSLSSSSAGASPDVIEAEIDVPLGSREHGLLVAFGRADGHLVTFERSLAVGGYGTPTGPSGRSDREQLFSFWSQSGGDRLRIRLRPEVMALEAACINVNLHIFAAKLEMLPLCPWKDTRIVVNGQSNSLTKESELAKFEEGVKEALALIKSLSEGTPVASQTSSGLSPVVGEQLDGSTESRHLLRHLIRAFLPIDLLGGSGQSGNAQIIGDELLREPFMVNSPQGVRVRFELSLDPPMVPIELVIEDANGLEYGRASRKRGRRLLFTSNALPEGTYYLILSLPPVADRLRKPPDGFPDAIATGAYCIDTTLMIVAEPGGPTDSWRQELLAYPELFAVEKLNHYPVHLHSEFTEMVLSVPLRVKHSGSSLTIRKSAGRKVALRMQSEPLNLKYGKLMLEDPVTQETKSLSPSGFLLLDTSANEVMLKFLYNCSPGANDCGEQPFLLTLAMANELESVAGTGVAPLQQTIKAAAGPLSGGLPSSRNLLGCTQSAANSAEEPSVFLRDLWQPEVARQVRDLAFNPNQKQTIAANLPICLTKTFVKQPDAAVNNDPVLGTTTVRAFDVQVPGPSAIKLTYWASDLAQASVKVGLVTIEGVWMAEQRGSFMGLSLELPGPAIYTIRVALTEMPHESNSFGTTVEDAFLGHFLIQTVPLGDELRYDRLEDDANLFSQQRQQNEQLQKFPVVDVSAARDLRPRSKCQFSGGTTLLPMDFFSAHGGSEVFHGPVRAAHFPAPQLYHAEVLLTDVHDGRKKVFLELPDDLQAGQFFTYNGGSSTSGLGGIFSSSNTAGSSSNPPYTYQLKFGGDFPAGSSCGGQQVGFRLESNGLPVVPLWSSKDSKVYSNLQPKQKLWLVFHREHRVRGVSACQRFHFFLALSATAGGGSVVPPTQLQPKSVDQEPACADGRPGSRTAWLLNIQKTSTAGQDSRAANLPVVSGAVVFPQQVLQTALYDADGYTVAPVLMQREERERYRADSSVVNWNEVENKLITLPGSFSVRRLKINFPADLVATLRGQAFMNEKQQTPYVQIRVAFSYLSGSPAFSAGKESVARWAQQEADDSFPGLDMARVLVVELEELLDHEFHFWWEPNFPDECGLFAFQLKLLTATPATSSLLPATAGGTATSTSIAFPLSKVVRTNAVQTEYTVVSVGKPKYAHPKPHLIENPFGQFHFVTWRRVPSERTQDFHVWLDDQEVYWQQKLSNFGTGDGATTSTSIVTASATGNQNNNQPQTSLRGGLGKFGVGGPNAAENYGRGGTQTTGGDDVLLRNQDGSPPDGDLQAQQVASRTRQIAVFIVLLLVIYVAARLYHSSQQAAKSGYSGSNSFAERVVELASTSAMGMGGGSKSGMMVGTSSSSGTRREMFKFADDEDDFGGGDLPLDDGGLFATATSTEGYGGATRSLRPRSPSRVTYGTSSSGGPPVLSAARNAGIQPGGGTSSVNDSLAPSSASGVQPPSVETLRGNAASLTPTSRSRSMLQQGDAVLEEHDSTPPLVVEDLTSSFVPPLPPPPSGTTSSLNLNLTPTSMTEGTRARTHAAGVAVAGGGEINPGSMMTTSLNDDWQLGGGGAPPWGDDIDQFFATSTDGNDPLI
ncbi:unnamed protein product [Amoebophrya sp. A120]|nr:unnamed protein product [Amoebophrya sp. A120]|eukprot:GSA120T00007575001.1